MSSAEIGVVIPTWNSAKTLATALLSLEQQEGVRVCIVVADSGSTDGTLNLCSTSVQTTYVPPGNMYRAINEGVRLLDTRWVAYLNSDDLVYTDAYRRLTALGEVAGAEVAYGNTDFVDVRGRFLYSLEAAQPRELERLFRAKFFAFMPHAAVFRRTVFERLGGFSENFRYIADMEFFARACFAGMSFASVPYPSVAAFRIHPGQISHVGREAVRQEIAQLGLQWPEKDGMLARWAVVRWKATNARQYLLRWLRTGSFHKHQP